MIVLWRMFNDIISDQDKQTKGEKGRKKARPQQENRQCDEFQHYSLTSKRSDAS